MNDLIIAFGDIHGVLNAAEKAVNYAENKKAQAIFLGDYVDRGKESMEVIELLFDAQKRNPSWKFLMGNHDFMLLNLINGKADPDGNDYKTKEDAYHKWLELSTIKKERITKFLANLDYYYENEDMIFVHAVLRDTGQAIHAKSRHELIWNYEYGPLWNGKFFIHGHLPVDQVKSAGKGININTSCGYGWGHLTGLEYNTNQKTECNIVKIDENGLEVRKHLG